MCDTVIRPPSAASVMCLLAAVCVLLVGESQRHDRVVINRSFITRLARFPLDRDLTREESNAVAPAIWEHLEEFRYLERVNDPDAVYASIAMIASGSVPGGCACDADEFTADLVHSGMPAAAWSAIVQLPPARAARVLRAIDFHPYDEADAPSTWQSDRDSFLARRLGVLVAYQSLIASK